MSSPAPTVTETGLRTFDVVNASSQATVKVVEPGVYEFATLRGQQVVVGNSVYRVDARARVAASGAVSFDRVHVCYRYGEQVTPLATEAIEAAYRVVTRMVNQVVNAVDPQWRHDPTSQSAGTLAQARGELALAQLAQTSARLGVARATERLEQAQQALEGAQARLAAADVHVASWQATVDAFSAGIDPGQTDLQWLPS